MDLEWKDEYIVYIGRGGWATRCNAAEGDSERDESTEEQWQCKQQQLYTLHGTLPPASPFLAIAIAMRNPCTNYRNEHCREYALSEITNTHSYCGECLLRQGVRFGRRSALQLSPGDVDANAESDFRETVL